MDEEGYDHTMQVDSIRRELRELKESKARRLIFRSRCNWALYGERPSKYFLNLEKRNAKARTLTTLLNKENDSVADSKGILEIAREFYVTLYTGQENHLAPMRTYSKNWTN